MYNKFNIEKLQFRRPLLPLRKAVPKGESQRHVSRRARRSPAVCGLERNIVCIYSFKMVW